MSINRTDFSRKFLVLFVAGSLGLGLVACGSDGNGDSNPAGTADPDVATQAGENPTNEVTPEKKAPESAKDKKNAPDDAISNRPGGPSVPVSP